ncbi:hypothetical protein LB456_07250 [Psychroflexus sp. CAK57W]|uniref:hypothetical protein n=1 Tax=Psychroflexus curvus TaxID=2873595 RepID=UPI001CC9B9DB|nr:hypothetical protein [Psychroflexus curvus]MBZ9787255.1 hypothetical protein [Psychroflexus curvus]
MNLKNTIRISALMLVFISMISCTEDEGLTTVNLAEPSNINASISMTQDNSGEVTFTPTGQNANEFFMNFGDGSELSDTIASGGSFTHTYAEGNYDVEVFALNVAKEMSQATKPLVVSFNPPENLEVTITRAPADPLSVTVSATADYAAGFEVTFGEMEDETPQSLGLDESLSYTYSSVGDFEITVKALSGGAATTDYSETITITDPLVLPVDFESSTIDYTFYNFGGGEGTGVPLVANPAPNSINDSETVASYTKVSGSETWAGTSTTLNAPIDFSNGTLIKMDVYSPQAGVPVLFKIENGENGDIFVESTQSTTVANEWETLTFDMSAADLSSTYEVLALFFNFNTAGTGETYHFDNIRTASSVEIALPLSFEQEASNFTFNGFGGGSAEVIANPDQSGINTSAQVGKQNKRDGSETWAGTVLDFTEKVDFNNSTTLTMKVWSPEANIPILLKFEDPDNGGIFVEVTSTVTEANTWTEVEFDFSGVDPSQNWSRMALFFNFGTSGTNRDYYFDDLTYSSSTVQDFEGEAPEFTVFGNIDPTEVVDNPNPTGANTTSKVAKLTKTEGSEVWAGTFFKLDAPLDLNTSSKISVLTHSPTSGITIKLKLEDENADITHEVDMTNTVANDWEELVYDFSEAPVGDYVRVVIFFDFGTAGDGSEYYYDEIKLVN